MMSSWRALTTSLRSAKPAMKRRGAGRAGGREREGEEGGREREREREMLSNARDKKKSGKRCSQTPATKSHVFLPQQPYQYLLNDNTIVFLSRLPLPPIPIPIPLPISNPIPISVRIPHHRLYTLYTGYILPPTIERVAALYLQVEYMYIVCSLWGIASSAEYRRACSCCPSQGKCSTAL